MDRDRFGRGDYDRSFDRGSYGGPGNDYYARDRDFDRSRDYDRGRDYGYGSDRDTPYRDRDWRRR